MLCSVCTVQCAVLSLGKYWDSHDPGGGQHGGEYDRDRAGGQRQVEGGQKPGPAVTQARAGGCHGGGGRHQEVRRRRKGRHSWQGASNNTPAGLLW